MKIIIYDTPTAENHIRKDLSDVVGEWNGAVRGEIDVVNPEILIDGTITTGNYAYIPDFGRYYWLREKTVVRENLSMVRLESDPLMSFSADIYGLDAYVFRSSANYNMDMADSRTPRVVYDRIQVIAPRGIGGIQVFNASDTNVYMQCIGGV